MRVPPILFLCFFFLPVLNAQATLINSEPNDTFDLACSECVIEVTNVSVTIEQRAIPLEMKKPVVENLLQWRYYDDILGKFTFMNSEPYWTKGTLLLDEVSEADLLALNISLIWHDSMDRGHQIFLVLAGLTKSNLSSLPATSIFDPDPKAELRFTAIAQISVGKKDWETYDCTEGTCILNTFNPKTGSLSGTFEFTGNRIGMDKLGVFQRGTFKR